MAKLLFLALGLLGSCTAIRSPEPSSKLRDACRGPQATVELVDPSSVGHGLTLDIVWRGSIASARLTNAGEQPVRVKEVVLVDLAHGMPTDTPFYGEGFTMLSQSAGTVGAPIDVGQYTDRAHYKIPEPTGFRSVYGVATFAPPGDARTLVGFASCRRFVGRIDVSSERLRVVEDCEGRELGAGETWELEDLVVCAGADREELFARLAREIEARHPRRAISAAPPTGWCSWYCFGPGVTAEDVTANLDFLANELPALRYVQIDDGYQPSMGDWLDSGPSFGGHVEDVLAAIRARGFEPALWVAPFVAGESSRLFAEHPDWFVMDESGRPLRSDRVTFGGWRLGPWYALDGTHPDAQRWLEELFRTLHTRWGVSYFKLDANFWGALHGGRFHDPRATRVDAYRRGMEAILRGAGDAFVLGCNHPMWPSLGVIDGSRSSLDVDRDFAWLQKVGRESLLRNWQNGRLWWNDPDCVLLTGALSDDEFRFHASLVEATGGMLLAGDDLTKLAPKRLAMLRKLVPSSGVAARFEDERFELGVQELDGSTRYVLLNWTDAPLTRRVPLREPSELRDFWSDIELGTFEREFELSAPPHGARIVVVEPAAH